MVGQECGQVTAGEQGERGFVPAAVTPAGSSQDACSFLRAALSLGVVPYPSPLSLGS